MSSYFQLIKKDKDTKARLGKFMTTSGKIITTPNFMPVATQASVKCICPLELNQLSIQIIISNIYHLYLRPGVDVIKKVGGLHKFISWDGVIMTDSGGYQIYSLGSLRKISDEGMFIQSHIDGSYHLFTPQLSIDLQMQVGADIITPLDECISYPASYADAAVAKKRTITWLKNSLPLVNNKALLFGIIQGSVYKDLRIGAVEELSELPIDGYAIGGLSVGEPKELTYQVLEDLSSYIPQNSIRYAMGLGLPEDILECVSLGIDLFDCVVPTRHARTGTVYTNYGPLVIRNSIHKYDNKPIDITCQCYTCTNFSRAYIRHLFLSQEPLGARLTTYHNLYFFINLIKKIQTAILNDKFLEFKEAFLKDYTTDKNLTNNYGRHII